MEYPVLEATAKIVVAAVSANVNYYPSESTAKDLAKFTEIVYEKLYELESKDR